MVVQPTFNTLGDAGIGFTDAEKAAPYVDPTVAGTYDALAALNATPTIDADKLLVPPTTPPACIADTLIKGISSTAVYYCGRDGRRYVFVNEHVFHSWFKDFSGVITVSDDTLASIRLGGNVTSRPGVRMLKITSDPRTYAVARGGVLRWIPDQATAIRLYGTNWNTKIDDVPVSYFFNYQIGAPVL